MSCYFVLMISGVALLHPYFFVGFTGRTAELENL